jgi:hypothetical protein
MITVGGTGSWTVIEDLLKDIRVPRMARVRQIFPRPMVKDIPGAVLGQIRGRNLLLSLKPGDSVALAVGSRGMSNQPLVVKTLVEAVREAGGKPFLVPAMGSHAGATAEGQAAMLRGMGFTEDYIGAPIRATMDVADLGRTETGLPILVDRFAYEADHIIIVNRIKPHVCFRGPYESGLLKMITIGLGKQKGADIAHNLGFGVMHEHIPEIAVEALKKIRLLFAVGLLENAFHETCRVELLRGDEIGEAEPRLLDEARTLSPKLYFDTLDALIIDEIGKDISGSGFDTNVVGRYHSAWISGGPKITRLLILDISAKSKGNGNGLGMADFTTRRAVEKFDFAQTYPNTLTATLTGGVKIPMVLPNDKQALQACIKTCNLMNWDDARIVRIRNTLCLTEIEVSENMLKDIKNDPRFEVLEDPQDPVFDSEGNLF